MAANSPCDVLVIDSRIEERTRLSVMLKSLPDVSSVLSRGSLREVEELMRTSGSIDAVFVGQSILAEHGSRKVIECLEEHFATKNAARIGVTTAALSRSDIALQIAKGFDGIVLLPTSPLVLDDILRLSLKMSSKQRELRFKRGLEILFSEMRTVLSQYYEKTRQGLSANITRITLQEMSLALLQLPEEAREQFVAHAVEKLTEKRNGLGNSNDLEMKRSSLAILRRPTKAA